MVPVTVAGQPVLLVRDAERRIRAFHNVCRHRYLKLVERPATWDAQSAARITPGRTDSTVRSTSPPTSAGASRERCRPASTATQHGLVPVRSATWHDWVFVNLNGAAPPFEDFVAPLQGRLEGLDLTGIHHLATIDLGEVAANWKLLMENFIEPYHVQFVHSTTTEQPLVDHYTVNEPGCLGCAVDVSGEATRDDTLSADSRYLTLFPNFAFGLYLPDQIGVHLDVPLAPDAPCSAGPSTASAPNRDRPNARIELARLWRDVHLEDQQFASGSSRGACPTRRRGGVLSPVWEDSVRSFQELVVERLR